MPSVSIIIVTYNPGEIVFECLRRLSAAQFDGEVIVVDNHSQDGTPQRLAADYPDVRLIVNMDNPGFARANNQGAAIARGELLLLLNPDVLVEPDTIAELVSVIDSCADAGVVGARTCDRSGRVSLTAHVRPTAANILWHYFGLNRLFPDWYYGKYYRQCRQAVEPFTADWVSGHCFLCRSEVYRALGGLDEVFFLFMEEPDFCDRAAALGWKTCYQPRATVTHQESTTISRYPLVKMRYYHLSPLVYFHKRQQTLTIFILKPGFIVELGLKLGVRLAQSVIHRNDAMQIRMAAYRQVIRETWRY